MKTIKTNVYTFDELDDKAKEKARQWYIEVSAGDEWWEYTYEDAKTIGLEITSFDLDHNRHAKGKFTKPAKEVAKAILREHGDMTETYKTAVGFLGDDDISEDDFLASLLEDYSIMLQRESEYVVSDEAVDENISANEYTFTKDGKRFG